MTLDPNDFEQYTQCICGHEKRIHHNGRCSACTCREFRPVFFDVPPIPSPTAEAFGILNNDEPFTLEFADGHYIEYRGVGVYFVNPHDLKFAEAVRDALNIYHRLSLVNFVSYGEFDLRNVATSFQHGTPADKVVRDLVRVVGKVKLIKAILDMKE